MNCKYQNSIFVVIYSFSVVLNQEDSRRHLAMSKDVGFFGNNWGEDGDATAPNA